MTKEMKWTVNAYAICMWLLVAIRIDLIEILKELVELMCLI